MARRRFAPLSHKGEEPESEKRLRRRVQAGFGAAVLLTALLGFLSWRNARDAVADAAWVAHTHEVSAALELSLRRLLDVESGGRGFALTGDLSHFWSRTRPQNQRLIKTWIGYAS